MRSVKSLTLQKRFGWASAVQCAQMAHAFCAPRRERRSYRGASRRARRLHDGRNLGVTMTYMRALIRYVCNLTASKRILWCYLIWYLTMIALYFDASIRIWLTSLGISAVIGFALLLSVSNGNTRHDFWTVARLFMMPFCVSSFSALVKGQGFILMLSPRAVEDALALSLCALFLAVTWGLQCVELSLRRRSLSL